MSAEARERIRRADRVLGCIKRIQSEYERYGCALPKVKRKADKAA